jgi:hypothetical protein
MLNIISTKGSGIKSPTTEKLKNCKNSGGETSIFVARGSFAEIEIRSVSFVSDDMAFNAKSLFMFWYNKILLTKSASAITTAE